MIAVAVALRKRVPWPPLVLMGVGALVFGLAHPKPTGPIGMALFLAGVAWIELRPRPAETPPPVAVQPI